MRLKHTTAYINKTIFLCTSVVNKTQSMNKIYYLSTCDTCKRIISDLKLKEKNFEFQDIKTRKITPDQLEEMKEAAGSYEALFSRIARKYKELGLTSKTLTETDYKNYILEEYTFLKRPVIFINDTLFAGNAKNTIEQVKQALNNA